MGPACDLKIHETSQDEVIVSLNPLQETQLSNPLQLKNVTLCFNPELVRENLKLAKMNPKAMHSLYQSRHRPDNNTAPWLHEVIKLECHVRVEAIKGTLQAT